VKIHLLTVSDGVDGGVRTMCNVGSPRDGTFLRTVFKANKAKDRCGTCARISKGMKLWVAHGYSTKAK